MRGGAGVAALLVLPLAAGLVAAPGPGLCRPPTCVRRSAAVRDVTLLQTEARPVAPWLTHLIRGTHVAALAGVLACPAAMDAAAGAVWRGYSALPFTGHPMFEACWAVTVFVLSIAFYESLHMLWPGVVRHRLDGEGHPRAACCT